MIYSNDFKQIIRSLKRKKLSTSINIMGLAIGLGSVILLTTFLLHEFSYDRFNSKSDRIYRVIDGKKCTNYYAMGEAFKRDIPEVEKVCQITNVSDLYTVILTRNNISYPIKSFMAADVSLFDMLDIEMIHNQSKKEYLASGTILISDRMARKYFGKTNSVGENLEFYIANEKQLMQISGVFKDLPTYSSFKADFICNISVAMAQFKDLHFSLGLRNEKVAYDFYNDWSRHNDFTTFVLLPKKSDVAAVEKKCSAIYMKHRGELNDGGIHLQPYNDMYLHSDGLESIQTLESSKFDSLRIFLSIGLLILLVACLNYILISSAEQEQSLTDIACRKINGASGGEIVKIVMLKSFMVSFISLIPAFIFAKLTLPLFNEYFGKELEFALFFSGQYLVALFVITAITALLGGTYLSMAAIKTNPANLLQKNLKTSGGAKFLNRSLIIIQFIVFIMLLSCMSVMRKQMDFSLNKDMGFKAPNTMVINLASENIKKQLQFIINEVKKLPHVLECQPTTDFLPPNDNVLFASFKDHSTKEAVKQEVIFLASGNIELIGISVVDGTSFSESSAKNNTNILINETAAKKFKVKAGDKLFHFTILGILKDFHNKSVHEAIRPLFIIPQSTGFTNIAIKTDGENNFVAEQVRKIISEVEPGYYFEKELLSDRIDALYKKDQQQTKIISFFSLVALVLAFMGLFGFVSISLSKKVKEIGIRKINGATLTELMFMLNRTYIKWVTIAFVIATPIAYLAMHKWLENFAYKTEISWWIFALAGFIALAIALITVSWQSWLAATRNPVESLRSE